MINTKVLKISKRIAIILLIAAFSIAGIVACSGDEITGSGGRNYSSENTNPGGSSGGGDSSGGNGGSGDDGSSGGDTDGDDTTILPNDSPGDYYDVRVPFGVVGDGYTNVSYKDTNKLKQLWFDQINRKAVNDGKVFAIRNRGNNRDANNFQRKHTHGQYSAQDYYYFNENGDIVYKEDNTIIKKLVGVVIIPYRDITIKRGDKTRFADNSWSMQKNGITWKEKNIYTIGAIYANALTTENARTKYAGDNPFKDGVFDFVTARHGVQTFWSASTFVNNLFERQYINPGFIEILVMYDYDNLGYSGAASVHSYYAYYGIYNYHEEYKNHPGIYFTAQNMPYMTNQNIYLAERPEFISKQLNHTAMFTDKHRGWEFLFMPGQKDISDTRRVVRINNGMIR
ncbi:hypothetical protein [Brachyspira sp.]|uniref:hypothetical protein n=1 Tax=Brachyspira sp. TaxID=1977261 RepID=UPI003D7EE182